MAKAPNTAKTDIKSPSMKGMDLVPKLGGMPKTLDPEEINKRNTPSDRSPAPGSFRPGASNYDTSAKDNGTNDSVS